MKGYDTTELKKNQIPLLCHCGIFKKIHKYSCFKTWWNYLQEQHAQHGEISKNMVKLGQVIKGLHNTMDQTVAFHNLNWKFIDYWR